MSPPHKIIILGAGLGGLILGQCLKAKNIPVTILEKASSHPRFNYAITLRRSIYQRLLPILQMHEASFLERCSISMAETQMDSAITAKEFRCHRGRLESFLREGLDIRWEQCLKGVQMMPQGISLQLGDGSTMKSDTLVGADGVHSLIRKSFFPNCNPHVLPYVVFNGRRSITIEDNQHGLQPHMAGQAIIQALHGNVLFRIYINEYTPTAVHFGYTYSRPARLNDPLHRPDRATTGADNITEEFYVELSQYGQKQLGPGFAEIFDSERVRQDRVLHWLMRSTVIRLEDAQYLADQGVWLIGDAAHPMPILGGEGANQVITDAIGLAKHLSNIPNSDKSRFLEKRHQQWEGAVHKSERRLSEIHGQSSPSPWKIHYQEANDCLLF